MTHARRDDDAVPLALAQALAAGGSRRRHSVIDPDDSVADVDELPSPESESTALDEGLPEFVTGPIEPLETADNLNKADTLEQVDDEPNLEPPDPAASRAGRNLPAAIGVGVGLAAMVVASLAIYRPVFLAIVVIAVCYGSYELVKAIKTSAVQPPLVPLLAGSIAIEVAAWTRGSSGLVIALLATALGIFVWRVADGAPGYARDVAGGVFVLTYVPFLAGFAVLMAHPSDGMARVIAFIACVVCNDVGGYVVGVMWGRHPMAPLVSPKKSWEGFGGSVTAGALCGALIFAFTFHDTWWHGVVFGIAIVFTATVGDLGESMIKRDLGVKDMGALLPGHGGLMDRLDSLLPSAAIAYLMLALFSI
jgi:phosphatidate cytidylyltransferase